MLNPPGSAADQSALTSGQDFAYVIWANVLYAGMPNFAICYYMNMTPSDAILDHLASSPTGQYWSVLTSGQDLV